MPLYVNYYTKIDSVHVKDVILGNNKFCLLCCYVPFNVIFIRTFFFYLKTLHNYKFLKNYFQKVKYYCVKITIVNNSRSSGLDN